MKTVKAVWAVKVTYKNGDVMYDVMLDGKDPSFFDEDLCKALARDRTFNDTVKTARAVKVRIEEVR